MIWTQTAYSAVQMKLNLKKKFLDEYDCRSATLNEGPLSSGIQGNTKRITVISLINCSFVRESMEKEKKNH